MDFVTLEDGSVRALGNNGWGPHGFQNTFAPLPIPPIPRDQWKDIVDKEGVGPDSPWLKPPVDQDGIGMCNCSATARAMVTQRLKQGLPFIELSAGDLYNRISGGSDNGSTLEDGIAAAMAQGVASVAVVPYLDWRNSVSGASADRIRFKVLEAYLCPTFDHVFTAVAEGFDLISGISWYDNYTPGSDGWLPNGRGNSGGHAIHGYKPTYRGSQYGIWHQNSWGSWGINGQGLFVIPESAYDNSIGGWWAVRAMTDEGGVVPVEG